MFEVLDRTLQAEVDLGREDEFGGIGVTGSVKIVVEIGVEGGLASTLSNFCKENYKHRLTLLGMEAISGLYYILITIIIDAARSDTPNWSVTLMIVIDDAS